MGEGPLEEPNHLFRERRIEQEEVAVTSRSCEAKQQKKTLRGNYLEGNVRSQLPVQAGSVIC